VPSFTVSVAVPAAAVVIVPVVFQYAFGAEVISFGPAGAVPPVPAVEPPEPVVPPRPAEPVVPPVPAVPPPVPAAPVVPADPLVPPAPVVPPVPVGSTQAPFVQVWDDPQQAVPHMVPAQVELQVVPLQTWPLAQTLAQLPQWAASDGTQEPLHSSWPLGQAHWLFWQVFPPLQGMPQAPQLLESVAVFTHSVPQAV